MHKPVTALAVKRRLNRRLAEKGECLRKNPNNSPWLSKLGTYYIAEINTDNVLQTDVDLEAFARAFQLEPSLDPRTIYRPRASESE